MAGSAFVCLYVLIASPVLLIRSAHGAPDAQNTWVRPPLQPQKTTLSLMTSIDERLQMFELSKWEATLKQLEQRLETMETNFRKLDTAFQDRLDKLERNLNSKELADELRVEKLSHKIRDIVDTSYDRFNRRLGYTEERLDMSVTKVQMALEASLKRIEKQQEDIQTEVSEAVTILEDLKTHSVTTEDKLNSTHKALQQHIQSLISPSHEELQRISSSLEHLGSRLNSSLGTWHSQNDGPQAIDFVSNVRYEINSEANKFSNKVNNMYTDLWRRLISVESLVKDLARLSNSTQREVLEELRSLGVNEHRDFPGDSQENFMEVAIDALERKLQRKLQDLGRKVDDRMDSLSASQNLMMDSFFEGGICHSLESRLTQVLERIYDVLLDKIDGYSNRTLDLDSLMTEMMELVKNQHNQMVRTVTHNTNMVVTLAKNSSDSNKLLQNSITQLAEKTDYNLQELHDDFQEISLASGKGCLEIEKAEENSDQLKSEEEGLLPRNTSNVFTARSVRLNSSDSTENVRKEPYDKGILKITFDTQSDNTSSVILPPKPLRLELNTSKPDSSVIQIVNVISPNLTQNQLDTLLQILNSSVSFDDLEAIVQNTQADNELVLHVDNDSVEMYNKDTSNNTLVEDAFNTAESKISEAEISFRNSDKNENRLDEYIKEQNHQNEITETPIEDEIIETSSKEYNLNQTDKSDLAESIKDQLKTYVLLMKIVNGNFNISQILDQPQQSYNRRERFLPILKTICYGEQNVQDFSTEITVNLLRSRLLLICQKIDDENIYEKIKTVCYDMTRTLKNLDQDYDF